ncbi:microtubule-associated protein futsch-like [Penaeus indicus]|uniref:microtubule-associated protein futsch-like n=1 Tax=Penaeus indicus TaxID=29960 RepID=UPI00300D0EC0
MKPGGLCSPTDGSSMPSGDTINSLSAHKSPSKGGHHPETSTAEEGHVDLPPLPPEGQLQLVPLAKSHANGMLPHEGIPNGLLSHGKGLVVPHHVRLPLHGESSREKGSVPCATSPGKDESKFSGAVMGQSPSKPTDAGTSSSLPFSHSLPTMCNKPFQQLSVVTSPLSYSSSKCNAPINAVPSCPGGNTLSPKMVPPGQGVSPKGVGLTSPKSLKSPKGRRKCSLEEMVTKLHNRTEAFQSGVSVLPFSPKSVLCDSVKLKNSAETVDRQAPLPAKGSLSDSQTQSGVSFPNICDNNNTARICDAHPALNPTVNVTSTRLHDETDKYTDNSSLTVCDIKNKVATDVSPEKIISNEVNKSQKLPVLHLNESCVDSYPLGNRNDLEGNYGTCAESSFFKVDGKGNPSSLQCNAEVTKNAQWGVMLNQCSSKPEVQHISQNKKCNENKASEICRTDCQSGDSSTSSLSDNLKSDQQQYASDQESARSATEALQCAERSESGLVGRGKDHQPVVESEKVREDKGSRDLTLIDNKGSGNTEKKEGCENLVSESCEVISKKVIGRGSPEDPQVEEVIPSEPQGNNELKTQLTGGECLSVLSKAEVLNVELSDNVSSKPQSEKEEINEPGDTAVGNEVESENVVSGTEQSGGDITGENTLRSDQQKDIECMNNQSSLKLMNKLIDLTAESESARSSSVELIENEPLENVDSESEIEILYEKKDETGRENTTEKSLPRGTEVLNSLQSRPSQVLPAVENKESEALPYLEPISDDENSLLCAPSTSSGLSSVSGFQSNSDTPMFSDTPSDASRGAIMVRISDAVAAILSDVSDESLPDSPLSFSDKTQGSSEKADDTIRSNTSEKIYANTMDNEKLLSTAVEKISTEETTKDSESLKDRGLTKDTVQPVSESASIIETDDSVCVDICVKSEQLGPKNTESMEKMDSCVQNSTVQSLACITEIEKRSLESPEPSRNICGLAPSTLSKLCSNSEQESSCQDSELKTAYHEQQKQLEPPSLLGEFNTGSTDGSSTSKSTCGITPIGQSTRSSQVSSLSTDKLDPLSSHTQVLLAESCTIACCSKSNNSSHICQNLISGSQKSSSQNQNCNTSQSGGSKDLGLAIKQPSAIIHNDESAEKNRVAGCESGDTIKSRLMCHSEDESARFSGKEKENFTNQSDRTSKSVQPNDGVSPTAMSVVVDNTVVTSDLAVSHGDNAQTFKEKVFSETEVPDMDDQRGSTYSHDATTSDVISAGNVTGTQKHTIGDSNLGSKEVPDRERSEEPENITKDFSTEEKTIASSERSLENHLLRQPDVLTTDCKQKFLDESNPSERASEICEELKSRHCHTFLDVNQSRMVDSHAVSTDISVKTCPSNTVSQVSEESCNTLSTPLDFYLLAEASSSSKTYTQDIHDLGREGMLVPPPSEIVNEVAHPLPAEVKDSLPQNVAATNASHPLTKDPSATDKEDSPVSEAEQGTVEEPASSQEAFQTAEANSEIPFASVAEINQMPDEIIRAKFAPTEIDVDFKACDFKHVPSEDTKTSQVTADITETSHASLEMFESNEVAAGLCSVISELCKISKAADEATKVATSEEVSVCMEATDEAAKTSQVLANVLENYQGAAESCTTSKKASDRMEASKSETAEAKTVKQTSRTTNQTTMDIFEEIQSLAEAVQEKHDVSETSYKLVDMKGMSTAVSIVDSCSSSEVADLSCSPTNSKEEQLPVVTKYQHSHKETEIYHQSPGANVANICSFAEGSTETIYLGDRRETCFSNADIEPSNQLSIVKTESHSETCVDLQDVQNTTVGNQMSGITEKKEMQAVNCNQDSAGKVSKIESSGVHLPLQVTDGSSHSLESVHVVNDGHCKESQSTESQLLVKEDEQPADLTSMSHSTVGSAEGSYMQSDLTGNVSPANLNDRSHPTEDVVEIVAAELSCSVAGDSEVGDSDNGNVGDQSSTERGWVDNSVIDDAIVDEAASEETQLEDCQDEDSDKLPSEVIQVHHAVDHLPVDHPPPEKIDHPLYAKPKIDQPSFDQPPDNETICDHAPVDEIKVNEDVSNHPPVDTAEVDHPPAEVKVVHPPVDEAEVDHPTVDVAEVDHPPVDEAEFNHPTVDEAEVAHPPVDEAEVDHPPVDEAEVDHPPVDEAEVDHPPVDEAEVDHPPVDEAEVDHPPVDEAEVDHPPVDEAEVDHPPVDEAEVDHPPVDEAEVDHPPVDEAEVDHPTVDEVTVDHPPVDAAEVAHPPVDEAVDHPSVDEAVDHPPVDEAEVGHPPVDEMTVDHPPVDEVKVDHPPVDELMQQKLLIRQLMQQKLLIHQLMQQKLLIHQLMRQLIIHQLMS